MNNLKKEIKAYMKDNEISYTSNMTKKELLEKIEKSKKKESKRPRVKKNSQKRKSRMKTRKFANSSKKESTQNKQKFGSAFAILRIALGLMFIGAGWSKIRSMMGDGGTATFFSSLGIPLADVFAWGVGLVELLGGIALVLGAFLSVATTLLTIIMIFAMMLPTIVFGFDINSIIEHLIYIGALLSIMFDDINAYAVDKFLK